MPACNCGSDSDGVVLPERSDRLAVFTGKDRVLAWVEPLETLAERSGQEGAALGLRYLLEEEHAARKIPHLVCFFLEAKSSKEAREEELAGAVVLFEYAICGLGTGLVASGDSFGVRTVFGPTGIRGEIAVAACGALLDRGARMVLVSLKRDANLSPVVLPPQGEEQYRWALAGREVQDSMMLGTSLEETFANLGKRTRTRLRAARKRFDATVPSVFVPDAIGLLPFGEDEFLEGLNRGSLDPIGQAAFNLQLHATERQRGGFVCGLHTAEHGWVALLGGWRQGKTTWVEWQVNQRGFERLSLGSVLRSYLMEEEVRQGRRRLGFHGSTSHSMAHSFLRERVVDVVGRRRSLLASLLVRLVPFVYRRLKAIERRGNFLADVLNLPSLQWTRRVEREGVGFSRRKNGFLEDRRLH